MYILTLYIILHDTASVNMYQIFHVCIAFTLMMSKSSSCTDYANVTLYTLHIVLVRLDLIVLYISLTKTYHVSTVHTISVYILE